MSKYPINGGQPDTSVLRGSVDLKLSVLIVALGSRMRA